MEMPEDRDSEYVWEAGWDEHRQRQLERLAKLSLAEKLEWLEQAHRVVMQLEKSRRAAGPGDLGGRKTGNF
jgi:hypothetical protein